MSTDTSPKSGSHADHDIQLGRSAGKGWKLPVAIGAVIVIAAGAFIWNQSRDSDAAAIDGSAFGTTMGVAYQADSASERAFLEYLDKEIAPDYDVDIDPVGIGDGNQLDQATAEGTYAANIYQHKHWLKQVVDKTGWKLTAVDPVFQWSYSVYSEKHASLDDIPQGGKIALLNDPANTAQALWLLERAGKLTFKDGTDPWAATENDIEDNIGGYEFTYVDYGAGPRALPEMDAVIAYNMQFIAAGVPDEQKIFAPPAALEFAGQLVVGTDYLDDPQVKKLMEVFFDPRVQEHLATTDDPNLKNQLSPVSES